KTFLKCFNAAIKEKLTYPGKKDMDPLLLESLKTSCEFDSPEQPDMTPVEVFSGYEAAQQYWVNEFIGGVPASNIEMLRDQEGAAVEERVTTPFAVSSLSSNALSLDFDDECFSFILAAYSALLLRVNGQEDMTIVASLDGATPESPLPLRLLPSWNLTFAELLQAVRQKVIVSKRHRVYGLHILTNPLTLSEYGCPSPVFDVGYSYGVADSASGLGLYPEVDKGLKLLLKVTRNEAELSFEFSYMKTWFRDETIEKLSSYLDSILKEAVINPAVVIGEIALQNGEQESESALAVDASEVFNF